MDPLVAVVDPLVAVVDPLDAVAVVDALSNKVVCTAMGSCLLHQHINVM